MVKYREILRQRAMGISIRNIAFSCGCSTATVVTVVDRAKARGLEWPLPEEMNDAAIRAVIYPREPKSDASKAEIDHKRVDREMERPGVTLMVLWSEYCDAALASGKEPYMYSAFCQRHRKWVMANKVAMHIERKPAQEMQVDYVGDTMGVLDLDTGELLKVYVFAACLPYSGELYAEGFYDMKEESWVEAHVHAFSFYGGSVPIIVPDNLKQGVAKNTVEELVINEQYRRMAEYYGCAIVPARPRKPRDKGAIEMGVRVIEQRAMAPLRDRVFTSLAQLNGTLMEKVREINARPFQKRDGSRDEVFIRQEKPLLVPLPGKPYEMVTRKRTRLLRQAGFPEPEANVADVHYDPDRKLDKVRIAELSNCEWIRNHRNVLLTGASGAGKSWIASALGVAACNAFFSVRYVRLPEMLDELTVEKDEEWFKTKKRYLKCDLLILDDWLLEKVSGKGARELLEIVEGRLRTGSLLICSQFSPAGWHAKLGEGAIADAVIDRIVYRSDIIHIEGDESMRKRIG